ncbi:High-affinity zinc uptake system ATP-binding protein ZnuC [Roseimaritima multifibrata]|uniref:High-affinity zinc uptake system ATP-binding protein ZnuC n=1 Tax=Roseimaritima multifibrata TaxID=1930274 RepID=A0A517MJ00_9BACT|nr:metal ABC transporter ATP-binding protein [Roseimaritima multifibrata]QDS94767.1 High-affinity zinc uptake system ATP-binding protein ZnuC [Roseimaritima multifibrata]
MSESTPPSSAPPLEAIGVTVAYRSTPVLQNISFATPAGSLTAIVGPNGAGKSTLIKAALNLLKTEAGEFRFFGGSFQASNGRIGYVPQRTSVDWDFPVTALDVVCMGLYGKIGWFRRVKRSHRDAARKALAQVGMEAFEDRQISQLSGGQQQRVFLARALVQDAELYLMDEPLAGVDAATEKTIIETLQKLRDQGRTAMVVHHDLQTVPVYFDRVLILNREIIAEGDVKTTFNAENLKIAFGGQLLFM